MWDCIAATVVGNAVAFEFRTGGNLPWQRHKIFLGLGRVETTVPGGGGAAIGHSGGLGILEIYIYIITIPHPPATPRASAWGARWRSVPMGWGVFKTMRGGGGVWNRIPECTITLGSDERRTHLHGGTPPGMGRSEARQRGRSPTQSRPTSGSKSEPEWGGYGVVDYSKSSSTVTVTVVL
jgi:hypothetical protein